MENNNLNIPRKLLKLKGWLTVSDTALQLSNLFGEEISEADVYKLAIDKHLKLSVNFLNSTSVSYEVINAQNVFSISAYLGVRLDDFTREYLDIMKNQLSDLQKSKKLPCRISRISGVWDLQMKGGERCIVEDIYRELNNFPNLRERRGQILVERDGNTCLVMEHHNEEYCADNLEKIDQLHEEWQQMDNSLPGEINYSEEIRKEEFKCYCSADNLPADSIFVVRTDALTQFIENLNLEGEQNQANKLIIDESNISLPRELEIAVKAWTELYVNRTSQGTPAGGHKLYIEKWLKKSYPDLGQNAVKRISTIINPNKKGGASPT
ncbi:MAG: hypothetical protein GY705_02760 [Bacteroidetes bacterium]|nr:hypothetical protein [Bacteroidota bacterium]